MGPLGPIAGPQGFMELASQGFPPLPPPLPLPGMNDSPLEFSTNKNQPPVVRESTEEASDRRSDKGDGRRDRDSRDSRDSREGSRRSRGDRGERRERDRERREEKNDRERRESRRLEDSRTETNSTGSNNGPGSNSHNGNEVTPLTSNASSSATSAIPQQIESATGVWGMGVGYPMMGMGPMGPMAPMMGEMTLGAHIGHAHGYGAMGMSMMSHDGAMLGAPMLGPEQIMSDTAAQLISGGLAAPSAAQQGTKEIIHCKSCTLFPPNPNAPPPTTRERPPGCRTIFVGGRTLVHLFRMTLKISA